MSEHGVNLQFEVAIEGALLGAQQIIESIAFLRRFFERSPRLLGIIPTFFDQRTNIASEIYAAIKEAYEEICPILPAVRIDTRIQQAVAKHRTIFEHAPSARAAEDYAALTSLLIEIETDMKELKVTNG